MSVSPDTIPTRQASPRAGLRTIRFGDAAECVRGVTFDKSEASPTPAPGLVPILRAGNIGRELCTNSDLVWVPSARVSHEQRLRVGDIAISLSSGSASVVGKTAIVEQDFDGAVGAFCGIIRPRSDVDPKYLSYWLRSDRYWSWRDSQARGANIQNLRFSELARLEIDLPPLAEQRRIAAILNGQMETVERARRAAEAQLEAAKALPAAHLREVFEGPEAKGWETAQLKDVSEEISKGTTPLSYGYPYAAAGVPFLAAEDLARAGVDTRAVTRFISTECHEFLRRSRLRPNDVLISIAGTLGRVSFLPDDVGEVNCNQAVCFVRLNRNRADRDFVVHALRSESVQAGLLDQGVGGGVTNLNLPMIRDLEIPLPPMDVQAHVAANLARILDITSNVVAASAARVECVDRLSAALLRHAFAGEL